MDNKGSVYQLNAQPLIPFALNKDWNLISRTVLPLMLQTDVTGGNQQQFGIGDTLQSLFLSPSAPTEQGFTWGVGPALLMPTATDNSLGIKQWAMGATAVVLRQSGHLTIGILANHLWSLGDGSRAYTATYTEPWISYVFSSNTTLSMSVESNYDWNNDQLTLPVNIVVDQLFVIGEQAVSVGVGVKYWAASPAEGPKGFGARLQVTFLWPK